MKEEFPAWAEVEHEVQVVARLERPMHFYDERMSNQFQDRALVHYLFNLSHLFHLRLAQRLECEQLSGVLLSN